jgi:hypothetical protein
MFLIARVHSDFPQHVILNRQGKCHLLRDTCSNLSVKTIHWRDFHSDAGQLVLQLLIFINKYQHGAFFKGLTCP